MEFIVVRQMAIEAETAEEALEKTKPANGNTISLSANPRPPTPVGVLGPAIRSGVQPGTSK